MSAFWPRVQSRYVHPSLEATTLTMRTVENSTRLQDRVGEGVRAVVVGSSFIGCEAAASLSMRGAAVTLASHEPSPQRRRLGAAVGERIEGWLRDFGVDLRLGVKIEGVERTDGGLAVYLDDGDTLDTGTVLFATGVRPRIQLAAEAGLEVDHGILTDSCMRTSAPGIYAVGDIAQAYNESAGRHLSVEHWGDALEHGRIAGTAIAGSEPAWSMAPASGPRSATRDSSTGPGETAGTSSSSKTRAKSSLSGTEKRACSSAFSPRHG